jgi:hypothetical protein
MELTEQNHVSNFLPCFKIMLNTDVNKFRSIYTSLTLLLLFEVFVEDRFKTLTEDGNLENFSQDSFFCIDAPFLNDFIMLKPNSSENIFFLRFLQSLCVESVDQK